MVGTLLGAFEGALVGPSVGAFVGPLLGAIVGSFVGAFVGVEVGTAVGLLVDMQLVVLDASATKPSIHSHTQSLPRITAIAVVWSQPAEF